MMRHTLSLRDFYRRDFEPLKLRGRSKDTKRLYLTTLNNFEKFLARVALLSDLNDETVSRFLDWFLRQPRGRSPYTANKERSNLLAIWRFAFRRNDAEGLPLVTVWPNVQPEVEPEDDPVAWLEEDLAALFKAIAEIPGFVGDIAASLWWLALHYVLWDTGERITATLRVRWADVDLRNGFITMRAVTRKYRRKGRTYKLHADTVAALKAIRPRAAKPEDLIFPWPYSATYVWNRYKKILEVAGLPSDRRSKFHRMRKSVASHGEAAGLNATELMGHSARKVTLRYLDRRIVRVPQAADVLFRPLGKMGAAGKNS